MATPLSETLRIKLAPSYVGDVRGWKSDANGETLLVALKDPTVDRDDTSLYAINPRTGARQYLGTTTLGKDGGAMPFVLNDGTVGLLVTEAPPGGGGNDAELYLVLLNANVGAEGGTTTPPPTNGGDTGGSSDAAVAELRVQLNGALSRIQALEANLGAAQQLAQRAMERANYVKGIYEPVWGRLDALAARPVGISRDEAWQLAADRTWVEVTTPDTGVRQAIEAIVAGKTGTVDQEARNLAQTALSGATRANEQVNALGNRVVAVEGRVSVVERLAQDAKNLAMSAQDTLSTLSQAIQTGIDRWFESSVRYEDKRLLNLLWDRGVKLAAS